MKKILFFACALFAVAAISSCTKQYITPNNNQTLFVDIPSGNWVRTTDGRADSTTIIAPQLDKYYNERGGVLVYMSFFKDSYEQIPEVYQNVSYSYYHYPGHLVLYAEPTNGATPARPKDMTVKIVLVESD